MNCAPTGSDPVGAQFIAPTNGEVRLIRAAIGPPLGSDVPRRRPVGRIGGIGGCTDPLAQARLAAALGPGAQLLATSRPGSLVADSDSCWVDGRPIERPDDWLPLLAAGRLANVEGAFSLAWNDPGGTLCLARDAVGERTLFYSQTPAGFVFASTIQALLASGLVPRRLNPVAVAAYLCYAYLPGCETLIDGVYELVPGSLSRYANGRLTGSYFWRLPPTGDASLDPAGLSRDLRERLERAVARRLPRGEPVGAFLSGGLDSSLVVALARQQHDAPVRTYSVSFGEGYANELPFSSLVPNHCGAPAGRPPRRRAPPDRPEDLAAGHPGMPRALSRRQKKIRGRRCASRHAGPFTERQESTMAVAEQVRNVLSEQYRDLIVEDLDDGSTVVRDTSAGARTADDTGRFPVSETLCRCADLLADSGFVIALVRDEDGVHLNAH